MMEHIQLYLRAVLFFVSVGIVLIEFWAMRRTRDPDKRREHQFWILLFMLCLVTM